MKSKEGSDDAAAIEQSVDELNQAMQALSQQFQRGGAGAQGADGAAAGAAAGGHAPQDDVIDAEFEKKE